MNNEKLIAAIRDGVPLVEPVHVENAMMAKRPARVVLSGGTGPVAAVHLVNISVTGWVHNPETAKAYADGFNRGTEWLRASIVSYAERATPAAASAGAAGTIDTPQFRKSLSDYFYATTLNIDARFAALVAHIDQHTAAARESEAEEVNAEWKVAADTSLKLMAGMKQKLDAAETELTKLRAATAPVSAAPQGELERLAREFAKWSLCMSYNDSYFGEPAGELKRIAKAIDRLPAGAPVRTATFNRPEKTYAYLNKVVAEEFSRGAPVSAAEPRVTPEMTQALADAEAQLAASKERREERRARFGLLAGGQQLPTTYSLIWESARMEPDPAGEWVKRADLAMGQQGDDMEEQIEKRVSERMREIILSPGGYMIDVRLNPENPTGYKRGQTVYVEYVPNGECIVIGENSSYLHLLNPDSGAYIGVNKAPGNLMNVSDVSKSPGEVLPEPGANITPAMQAAARKYEHDCADYMIHTTPKGYWKALYGAAKQAGKE